jgi:uncharacterized protein
MKAHEEYYVYCYFDPRNREEFYYGKGKGNRSQAHLLDLGKSEKAARIKQIKAAEGDPIIRIIATDLTEDQAFLVEAALIWKLGDRLTDKNSGRYGSKFRPKDTLHKRLPGFDFSRRIHFFNTGEPYRSWDDCRTHGFLSTGHGLRYKKAALQLQTGDIVAAYWSRKGYVGIGRVTAEAVPARDFRIGHKPLEKMKLKKTVICHDSDDLENCEYVIRVKWLVAKKPEEALWKHGLFRARQTQASLKNQPTLRYIEKEWGKKFEDILEKDES